MRKDSIIRARRVTPEERADIARCFSRDAEWSAVYTPSDTLDLVRNEVIALAIDVPPRVTTTQLYALYLHGCTDPLFVQVRSADGDLYEAGCDGLGRRRETDGCRSCRKGDLQP